MVCQLNICMSYTSCVCKDAEDMEQNDWTAWPDHSVKKAETQFKVVLLNLCCIFLKANGNAGRHESQDNFP